MVRLRSTKSSVQATEPKSKEHHALELFQQENQDDDNDLNNSDSIEEDPSPKASFNGTLQHYTFSKPSTTSSTTLTSSTTITTTTRRPPKRKVSPPPSSTFSPAAPAFSPRPTKKRRSPSKYAPPSKYAHLPPLNDILTPSLLLVFIGVNPGIQTATAGHAYAHPSNLFWKLLHTSGITDRRLLPAEDGTLPELYSCGNTNIVSRPTKDQSELSKAEMDASVASLEAKINKWRPEAVCIVGKGIWESVWRARYGRGIRKHEFRFGWQDEGENMGKDEAGGKDEGDWKGAKIFVATSTSGLAASLRPHEKEAIWKPLGEWVAKRRRERAAEGMENAA